MKFTPIGLIHSPYKRSSNCPIQPTSSKVSKGTVEIFPKYAEGLAGLDGFSHLILIFYFHMAKKFSLSVEPFLDNETKHGVFSTRAPARPNPIGFSIVRLEKVKGRKLLVKDLDMIDKTPVLDIKPYVALFDCRNALRIGWYNKRADGFQGTASDDRFER